MSSKLTLHRAVEAARPAQRNWSVMEEAVSLLLTIKLSAELSLSQRVAPQVGHFAVPPGRAVPQFAQNFLIAGATSVGCEPIDWDPVE